MNDSGLRKWIVLGVVAAAVIVVSVPLHALRERRARSQAVTVTTVATFVGRESCVTCHPGAARAWTGSDHDLAMAAAVDSTVLGDFDNTSFTADGISARFFRRDGGYYVNTAGPDGIDTDFEITHTFGADPLQQYLVSFPGGRLQAVSVAWDTIRNEWFFLYPGEDIPPDDWLHWTRGGQNWNGMCAECHSTNLRKNYDPDTDTYATTWSEIDVSCEACHGPGSEHVAWAELPPMARPDTGDGLVVRTSGLTGEEQVTLCAPCHARRSELGDYDHRGAPLLDSHLPSTLDHALYHPDGQIEDEVYVYGSFVQSKMYRNNVGCSDCHDIHSLELRAEGNELCASCHRPDAYDTYDHHFHQREHEGQPSDGHLCVKCHMPEQPYMVVDWRADHSIRIPRPDLSLELGTPNACGQTACHADKSTEWAAEYYRTWYGVARKPHYGTILAAGRDIRPDAGPSLAALAENALYPAIVRATALTLLPVYGTAGRDALGNALEDEDPLVRATAAENFAPQSEQDLVDHLGPLLLDPVRAVRMQAAVRLAGVASTAFKPYQSEARDRGIAEYEAAMSYSLDFAASGHNLGNLYGSQGDPAKAARFYERALAVDDLFYPAKVNLAMIYNSQGRNGDAERLLSQVTEEYPEVYEAAYSLALLLVEMRRPGEALPFLARAAAGMPGNTRVRYNYGLLLQQENQVPEARAELEAALALEPGQFDLLFALADHHFRYGDARTALEYADTMVRLYPDNPTAQEVRAAILTRVR